MTEDGTVRTFTLPHDKAERAIVGLGSEVSSIVFSSIDTPRTTSPASSGLWLAFGNQVACFDIASAKLVMKLEDASTIHTILDGLENEQEDVLNEVRGTLYHYHGHPRSLRPCRRLSFIRVILDTPPILGLLGYWI